MVRISEFRDLPFGTNIETQAEQLIVDPISFWGPPKGLDYETPTNRVDNQFARQLKNIWLDIGKSRSRHGTVEQGTIDTNSMQVSKHITSGNLGWLIRWLTDDIQYWDGAAWQPLPGATSFTFTGATSDKWAYTGFGDDLVFSNNINGMYNFRPLSGTTDLITDGPNAQFLTTFGSRIVACNIEEDGERLPNRIRWSAKNNSLQWDILTTGPGFEDLLSTPGGSVDLVFGVHPVSDFTAFVLRKSSVWTMRVTGNVDAPFSFDRIYGGLGLKAPYSVVSTPSGVVGVFTDDIYVLSENNITPIGTRIRDQLFSEITNVNDVVGAYDERTREYLVSNGQDVVYRYSFADQGWARSVYPRNVIWVDWNRDAIHGTTIDELTGDIDSLTGTIESLKGTAADDFGFFAVSSTGFVFREDYTTPATDDEIAGVGTDSTIEFATAYVRAGSSLRKTRVIEVQVEYEADQNQTLVVDYSTDNGATWTQFSTKAVVVTTGPEVISFVNEVSSHRLQLRLTSTILGRLHVYTFHAFATSDDVVHN